MFSNKKMVKSCCVEGCKASWRPDGDLSFFSFPMKNEDLLKEWLQVVPTNNQISKNSRICSVHFEESQYECISGKRFLKKNAIPSIFSKDIAKFKEIITEVEKSFPASEHIVVESVINDNSNNLSNSNFHDHCYTQEHETFVTYKPLPSVSNIINKAIQAVPQTQSVGTQTPPRRTEKEKELQCKIKILQSKLRRKELKIINICRLVKHIKRNGKCLNQLDHLYAKQC